MTLQEPDKAAAAFEVWQDLVAPEVTCTRRTFPAPLLTACVCVCVTACLSQSALALRPKDSNLAVLAANAYVAAHDYNRAIDHCNR